MTTTKKCVRVWVITLSCPTKLIVHITQNSSGVKFNKKNLFHVHLKALGTRANLKKLLNMQTNTYVLALQKTPFYDIHRKTRLLSTRHSTRILRKRPKNVSASNVLVVVLLPVLMWSHIFIQHRRLVHFFFAEKCHIEQDSFLKHFFFQDGIKVRKKLKTTKPE